MHTHHALLCGILWAKICPHRECNRIIILPAERRTTREPDHRRYKRRHGQIRFASANGTWVQYFACTIKQRFKHFYSPRYQCQIRVLNSADYGAPQQRNRVIFWAAKLGIALPKWPVPTHIPRGGYYGITRKVAGVGHIPIALRDEFEDEDENERRAPFYSVTIEEAIGDLVRSFPCKYYSIY